MPDFIPLLTAHYSCDEASGDLIDAVGSADWTEVGTVGSVSDGLFGTARGPVGGAGGASPGFTLVNSDSGPFDIRGATSCSFMAWFRLNSVGAEDNIIFEIVGTIDEDVLILRPHHRTSPPAANPSTAIIFASDDGSGFPNFALAPGSPFKTQVASSVWQLIGFSYDARTAVRELRIYWLDETGTEHTAVDTGHPGWGYGSTTTMGLGKSNIGTEGNSGLRGDIDHIDWFVGYALTLYRSRNAPPGSNAQEPHDPWTTRYPPSTSHDPETSSCRCRSRPARRSSTARWSG